MSTTAAWILSVAGSGMCLFLAAQAFRFWIAQDWPRVCSTLVAVVVVSTVVFRPTLPLELAAKLRASLRKDLEADPGPTDHDTTSADGLGHADGPPWGTIALVLGIAAAAVALLLAALALAAGLRRRRERTQQQTRRSGELAKRRADLEARHDAVRDAYGDFEMNLLDNLHRLALGDVNVPQTARLIDALDAARDARISTAPEALDTYRKAVTALELAWKSADHHARTTGAGYLPRTERRNIEQAQAALAVARDERGYAPQRQLALRRALTLIESVIPVPQEAIAALETSTRPALASH
ncbi:hypothetical protein OG883_43640 [Streptomyces sp. NBC_01142]|uniref:hypothetical protein n=1 Tax=Streptomyces sp. NBC_01142 TaxID=2975865 RepID=UPI00224EDDFC|nr:hypothetical protein [Streptomyces sp. NBC_01142]MCX4826534.1 hypothetical protein [Streptomyces sp. NBC_01142]